MNNCQKALLFSVFLVTFFVASLVVAMSASGPIIVGTEMNTNGLVEYLCIGTGCEDI